MACPSLRGVGRMKATLAALAVGLVLGLGVTMTLASDAEAAPKGCTVVWPLLNRGVDHGVRVTYKDRGDYIEYSRKVSGEFRHLVEGLRGTAKRGGCR